METVKRAKLKNQNDILGMLLELATFEAFKQSLTYNGKGLQIGGLVIEHSPFDETYQENRNKGSDIIFRFRDDWNRTGAVECKNVNKDFIVGKNWWKNSVKSRFYPRYNEKTDTRIVVISHFKTSPKSLRLKLEKDYYVIEVGFQVTDQETYEEAICIIAKKLYIGIERQRKWYKRLEQEKQPC